MAPGCVCAILPFASGIGKRHRTAADVKAIGRRAEMSRLMQPAGWYRSPTAGATTAALQRDGSNEECRADLY